MADTDKKTHSLDEFLAGVPSETGKPLHLVIIIPADLRVELRGAAGHEPAANLDYRARGPDGKTLSGTTDSEGRLEHLQVPSGEYELTVDDVTLKVPTVQRGDAPHVRWFSKHPRSK